MHYLPAEKFTGNNQNYPMLQLITILKGETSMTDEELEINAEESSPKTQPATIENKTIEKKVLSWQEDTIIVNGAPLTILFPSEE